MTAVLDPEVLGHRDLDRLEMIPAPERLEHRVRESEVEDLLDTHLPQVVVDPIELRFVDVLVKIGCELTRGLKVVAERLLDDYPRVLRQPGLGQPLHDPSEEK